MRLHATRVSQHLVKKRTGKNWDEGKIK